MEQLDLGHAYRHWQYSGMVRVQQALNLAINKQEIIDAVFQGASMIAKNPFPPTIWSYNDTIKDYPYDPDKAKQSSDK